MPESGLDCLMSAEFARQRVGTPHAPVGGSMGVGGSTLQYCLLQHPTKHRDCLVAHLGAWEVFGVEGYDRVLDLRGSAQREKLSRIEGFVSERLS